MNKLVKWHWAYSEMDLRIKKMCAVDGRCCGGMLFFTVSFLVDKKSMPLALVFNIQLKSQPI